MFPWEVLITGAVGIGGTSLGAWLNGRMQTRNLGLSIDAENKRARLTDKQRIYAAYLAEVETIILAIARYKDSRRSDKYSEEEKKNNEAADGTHAPGLF